jgi:hypothetical protein
MSAMHYFFVAANYKIMYTEVKIESAAMKCMAIEI